MTKWRVYALQPIPNQTRKYDGVRFTDSHRRREIIEEYQDRETADRRALHLVESDRARYATVEEVSFHNATNNR